MSVWYQYPSILYIHVQRGQPFILCHIYTDRHHGYILPSIVPTLRIDLGFRFFTSNGKSCTAYLIWYSRYRKCCAYCIENGYKTRIEFEIWYHEDKWYFTISIYIGYVELFACRHQRKQFVRGSQGIGGSTPSVSYERRRLPEKKTKLLWFRCQVTHTATL